MGPRLLMLVWRGSSKEAIATGGSSQAPSKLRPGRPTEGRITCKRSPEYMYRYNKCEIRAMPSAFCAGCVSAVTALPRLRTKRGNRIFRSSRIGVRPALNLLGVPPKTGRTASPEEIFDKFTRAFPKCTFLVMKYVDAIYHDSEHT